MEEHTQPVAEVPKDNPNTPSPTSQPQYEFTEQQNEVMKALEWKLGVTGAIILLASIGFGIHLAREMFNGTFPYGPRLAVGAWVVVALVFAHGGWLLTASSAFEQIHKTQGHDIDHLMKALDNVNKFFTLMGATGVLVIVASVIRGVMLLFS
ncbi:MAG: hypothetical protein HYS12_04195 [Planctomycetes bacterium]|nr:hypothetical protein [Planctomycetota bacterium]